MKAVFLGTAALAIVVGLSLPAGAHHPHLVFYDQCTSLTIEGDVESVQWKNPHVLIDLITNDKKPYRAEWTSAAILKQMSVEPPKAGDRVVVRGNPMRDLESIRAKFPDLTLNPPPKPVVDLIEIRRPSDGWSWGGAERPSQDCGRK